MHSLLEHYLEEVAARLSPLPKVRREEELREMRQHLLNAMIAYQELGQNKAEATKNVLEQFGAANALGENIVWAWRRGEIIKRQSFWKAVFCTTMLSFLLPRCWDAMERETYVFLRHTPLGQTDLVFTTVALNYIVHALAGGISGMVFPRRAIAGASLAATIWYGIPAARVCLGVEWVNSPAVWALDYAIFALITVLAAWAGSRWRANRRMTPMHSLR